MARLLVMIALIGAAACSGEKGPKLTAAERAMQIRMERAEEARNNLWLFYEKTFGPLIQGDNYTPEMELVRLNHYAHRLWIPERDWTYDVAMQGLLGAARRVEMVIETSKGEPQAAPVAYFLDRDQLHRDQYAMILSEMSIGRLGDIPLSHFVNGAMVDYGSFQLSRRPDQPWTVALLAANKSPRIVWPTAAKEAVSVKRTIEDMIFKPVVPETRTQFDCFNLHSVYGLMVAVENGYTNFRDFAKMQLAGAFEYGAEIDAASIERSETDIREISGRIQINGHLIEVFFRAGEETAPLDAYEVEIDLAIGALLRDSEHLVDLPLYEGPLDMFVSVPHAIHGLDLAVRRMSLAVP